MILTVITGNTNTRLTALRGQRISRHRVVRTQSYLEDATVHIAGFQEPDAVALASVVPGALAATRKAVRRIYHLPVFAVGPKTRTGMAFDYDRTQLGADRVCVAVGTWERFPGKNTIALDMGTAVTMNVISSDGRFLGGAILPGQSLMLHSLSSLRAGLPRVGPATRRAVTQHSTKPAMQAGVRHVLLGGIRNLVTRVCQETGRRFGIVTTGGQAHLLRGQIPNLIAVDVNLVARGLARLFELNRMGTVEQCGRGDTP